MTWSYEFIIPALLKGNLFMKSMSQCWNLSTKPSYLGWTALRFLGAETVLRLTLAASSNIYHYWQVNSITFCCSFLNISGGSYFEMVLVGMDDGLAALRFCCTQEVHRCCAGVDRGERQCELHSTFAVGRTVRKFALTKDGFLNVASQICLSELRKLTILWRSYALWNYKMVGIRLGAAVMCWSLQLLRWIFAQNLAERPWCALMNPN